MNEQEHREQALKDHTWTTPQYYAGYDPVGEYCIATKHRDSSILEQCNWDTIRERLIAAGAEILQDGEGVCYDWRAGHCMVGWVEYLMLKPEAPQVLKDIAADCLLEIEDYPVLDEDSYSEAQYVAMCDYWGRMSIKERVEYCRENGESIFAARSDCVPPNVYDHFSGCGEFN